MEKFIVETIYLMLLSDTKFWTGLQKDCIDHLRTKQCCRTAPAADSVPRAANWHTAAHVKIPTHGSSPQIHSPKIFWVVLTNFFTIGIPFPSINRPLSQPTEPTYLTANSSTEVISSPAVKMSSPSLNKIAANSPSRQNPSELETSIAGALYDLETGTADLKAALRPLQFVSAKEV